MKRNKLLIAIGVAILISVASVLVCKTKTKSEPVDVIRIGVILPLTGAQAQDGREVRNAIALAANRVNANQKDGDFGIDIDIYDSKDDSKNAITIFNAMKGNHPNVVIVGGSVVSRTLAPLASKYRIPVLSLLACDDDLPNENEWIFRSFPSDKEEIGLMVQYAVNKLNVRKVAVLAVDNIQGTTAIKYIKEYAKVFGCEVCAEDTYAIDAMDTRAQVSKILEANPDSVYVFGYGVGFCNSINQFREMEYKKSILTWSAMSLSAYKKALKGSRTNIFFTAPPFSRDLNEESRIFYDEYVERYKMQPGFIAAMAYETIRMIVMSAKPNGQSAESFCAALNGIKSHESITGEIGFNGKRGLQVAFDIFTLDNDRIIRTP